MPSRVVVHVHCPRRPCRRKVERRPHRTGRAGGVRQSATELRDRGEHLLLIKSLMAEQIAVRTRHTVRDEQQREAIECGLRRAVHRARRAWTARRYGQARPSGQQAIRRGHHARGGLAMGEHETKTRFDGRADHFEVRSASWEPEHHIGAAFAHAFGQYLRQPVAHSDRTLFHLRVAATIGAQLLPADQSTKLFGQECATVYGNGGGRCNG